MPETELSGMFHYYWEDGKRQCDLLTDRPCPVDHHSGKDCTSCAINPDRS